MATLNANRGLARRVVVVALSAFIAAFAACEESGGPTEPTRPSTPVTTVTETNARQQLPQEPPKSSGPQASGSNISRVEVAGRGTTRYMSIANDSSSSAYYSAGDWFEPKDGRFQRMMILETVTASPGRVVDVPTACMQQSKKTPAVGARFFSRPKSTSGVLQQCQESCLGRSDAQGCIWACERPKLIWKMEDGCNDGISARYRFFLREDGRTVRTWPGGNRYHVATSLGTKYTSTLEASAGSKICYGADDGRGNYWGLGLDGDRGCTGCCYNLPESGPREVSTRLTCS